MAKGKRQKDKQYNGQRKTTKGQIIKWSKENDKRTKYNGQRKTTKDKQYNGQRKRQKDKQYNIMAKGKRQKDKQYNGTKGQTI